MSDFVRKPLQTKLNRRNILTRLEQVERLTGAGPSARVDSLGDISSQIMRSSALIDERGIILRGKDFEGSQYIQWVDYLDGAKLGFGGSFIGTTDDITFLAGVGKSAAHEGKSALVTFTHGAISTTDYRGLFFVGENYAALDMRNAVSDSRGTQSLVVQNNIASSDNDALNEIMFLDTYAKGTPAAGFGTAIALRAEDTNGDMETVGYIAAEFTDPTHGSEDSQLAVGWLSGGVAVNGKIVSGTYTPTLNNTTNISSSTAYAAMYTRVGNVVTVSGRVDVTATAGGANTVLGISLPISSNLADAHDLAGTGVVNITTADRAAAAIGGDTTNDRANVAWWAPGTSSYPLWFQFSYVVK